MNVLVRLLFIVTLSLGLLACGESDEEKAQKKVESGQAALARIESNRQTLTNYGFIIGPSYGGGSTSPICLDHPDKVQVRRYLEAVTSDCNIVLNAIADDNVTYYGDINDIYNIRSDANSKLQSLDSLPPCSERDGSSGSSASGGSSSTERSLDDRTIGSIALESKERWDKAESKVELLEEWYICVVCDDEIRNLGVEVIQSISTKEDLNTIRDLLVEYISDTEIVRENTSYLLNNRRGELTAAYANILNEIIEIVEPSLIDANNFLTLVNNRIAEL